MKTDKQKGFTLLELLVVLVVIGLAASFVGPNLWRTYSKAQERSVIQTFADALQEKRLQAYRSGKSIELSAVSNGVQAGVGLPQLPDGWRLEKSSTVRFLSSGVTNGGSMAFRSPDGNRWQMLLNPLDGRVGIRRL